MLVLSIAAGLGRTAHKFWRAKEEPASERLLLDTTLGLGVLSLLIFALGALQLFQVHIIWALLAILLVVFFASGVLRDIYRCLCDTVKRRHSLSSILVFIFLLILALAALIPALAPPSMDDWDSLAYHLSVPKLYLQHGGIYYVPFTSHSNFPFLMEMLYIPGLSIHDTVASKLMNYWVGILLAAAVFILAKKHFNAKAAPLAAIAFAGMPIVLWEATTAYIDLATALYTVICVHLMLNYFDTNDRKYLIGCAISAGFAASTKMTALALIPLLIIWLVIDRFAAARKFELKRGLMLAGVALLVCLPWYIKSILYTGNPVYPFFYSIFGGKGWTAALAQNYSTLQAKFGAGHDLASFILLPYDLTFFSDKFYDTPGLYLGPILLLAVPLLLLGRYASRKLLGMSLFFFAMMVVWFGLTLQSRYLIPAFAVLAVLISAIVNQDDKFRITRIALMGVFVATGLFGILTLYPAIKNSAPVAFGLESRDDYLTRSLDTYPAQKYINETLPGNARVAFYGDTRGFYLDHNYVWADPGHNVEFSRDFKSVEEMVSYLKSRGVTHAMVNFRISFPSIEKAGGIAKLIYQAIDRGYFKEIYPSGNGYGTTAVYEII